MPMLSRRKFLKFGLASSSAAFVTTVLPGCEWLDDDDDETPLGMGSFQHGIASGDPLTDSVILWTRVTPDDEAATFVLVAWDIATDLEFTNIIASARGTAVADSDFTVKVDVKGLDADSVYYYRFRTLENYTVAGTTRTLPDGTADSLNLAVMSCANYSSGYFHVYQEVAQNTDLDIVLHLGDYLYEYANGIYPLEADTVRAVMPDAELVTLDQYRTRYAQYRTDLDLQAAHAAVPFIMVWDDHEVANDSWEAGAENHSEEQGDYLERQAAAMRAYFEWLPIRPVSEDDDADLSEPTEIYRQFLWGDLVDLLMLDTRHIARDEPNTLIQYASADGYDFAGVLTDAKEESRELLGATQLSWIEEKMLASTATWQLLGQQILMGRMYLPGAVATQQMSISDYAELGAIAVLAARAQAGDPTLTEAELSYLAANQDRLTEEVMALLQAPALPYNLDAWDGYDAERERLYSIAKAAEANLVVVAGDTHNAWANHLTDNEGNAIGVELATASVSSPGLEYYLGVPEAEYAATEGGIVGIVDDLQYLNMADRGLLTINFTHQELVATWTFVSSIKDESYSIQTDRTQMMTVAAGSPIFASE